MKIESTDSYIRFIPESQQEKDAAAKFTSKMVRAKPFVDRFGATTNEFFLETFTRKKREDKCKAD
jgi:hypothetical protein